MHVFLSHSQADRKLAATLRGRLEAAGLTVSSLDDDPVSTGWHRHLEEALRSAAAILLLVSTKVDEPQRTTWRLALEAVWADPSKQLIPILLQDAELPPFVKSASSGREVQAVRLRDLRDLDPVVRAILRTLGISSWEDTFEVVVSGQPRSFGGGSFDIILSDPSPIETYPAVTEEDRKRQREDFAAIRKYAEQLKH